VAIQGVQKISPAQCLRGQILGMKWVTLMAQVPFRASGDVGYCWNFEKVIYLILYLISNQPKKFAFCDIFALFYQGLHLVLN
jgi:hypothetical protein